MHADYSGSRVGGDYFDATLVPNNGGIVFLLADVAGDSHDSQTIAAQMQSAFRQSVADLFLREDFNSNDALVHTLLEINGALMTAAQGVRCTPTFIGFYSPLTHLLTYINAGAPPALLRCSTGTTRLESNGLPLGLFTHLVNECAFAAIEQGAALVLVSKGVVEARHKHEEFGIDRVSKIVDDASLTTARALCDAVLETVQEFHAVRHPDDEQDMTTLALVRTD
jgi:serine phosphatase RsbU (regulator of sigma subunit)